MTVPPPAVVPRFRPGSFVQIVYANESGEVSQRRVRVERWLHGRNGFSYLKGWCFLRGEERTFRADRIREWTIDRPAREVLPAPAAATAVPTMPPFTAKPARRARTGGRGWLGLLAAGAVFFIIRSLAAGGSLVTGGSQPAPVSLPKPDVRPNLQGARSLAFSRATGISASALESAYEKADANRDGRLDWGELSRFQSRLERTYAYRSNELALRPDQFLAAGGGDCEDWALFTCGLLRYWGWDPWVGSLAPSRDAVGHAVCLVRVPDKPGRGTTWWAVEDDGTLGGHPVEAGWYVPIDYDSVGSLSSAVGNGWELRAIWKPESIYEERM